MRSKQVLTVAVAMIAGLMAINTVTAEDAKKAPAFTLTAHDGKEVSLSDYKGKIVVLEWYCDSCPASKAHHKTDKNTMVDLAGKYADKGVVWLAINSTRNHDVEHNAQAAAKQGVTYPILDDSEGTVGKAYGAKTTPHMFIVHKDGTIAYDGAIDNKKDTNYVDQALTELVAGQTVSTPKTRPYGCGVKYKK